MRTLTFHIKSLKHVSVRCVAMLISITLIALQSAPALAKLVQSAPTTTESAALSYAPQSVMTGARGEASSLLTSTNTKAPRISANLQLALANLHGLGAPVDIRQAGKLMMAAWTRGEGLAAAGVALCHLSGCYGVVDSNAIQLWIDRARRFNPGKAKLLEWQWAQMNAQSKPSAAADLKVQRLLMEAVSLGDPVALNERALQLLSLNQTGQAIAIFEKARASGSPAAAHNLDKLQQTHNNLGLDAQNNGQRQGALGNSAATTAYELAVKYHRGDGVPVNITQAISHYQRAAQLGNIAAQNMLRLIFSRLTPQGLPSEAWILQLAPRSSGDGLAQVASLPAVWYQKDSSLLIDWMPSQQNTTGLGRSFANGAP